MVMQRPLLKRPRRRRLKGLPFNRMIPNILTLLALCAGMTAILFALQGKWEPAVLAIMVAGVLDGLDGRVARILKGTSKFGAELDSLSDFISFGVAPPLVLYLWSMHDAGRFGWILTLLFAACCALRLARFNTDLDEPDAPPWAYNFFTGVPSPAGGGLVLLPLILSFQFGDTVLGRPIVVGTFLVAVAALLVSRVPTFAMKKFKIPNRWVLPTMLFVALVAASVVSAPWTTLSALMILYIATFPLSIRAYAKLKAKADTLEPEDDDDGDFEEPETEETP
jgi:CDP-diacylglycerol---serine O-phosphatidyltransferase